MAAREPLAQTDNSAPPRHRAGRVLAPILACLAFTCGCVSAGGAVAQEAVSGAPEPTYADLADLAVKASIVPILTITGQAAVEPERSPGLRPGTVRLYLEAETETLLAGDRGIGESVRYLADVPLGANGKPPNLRKARMIVFAHPAGAALDQLQLVERDSQLLATPVREGRVRAILTELVSPDAPPHVTGVRDVLAVPGNLAGEWETQIFLSTGNRAPASITILRRAGQPFEWGVSWNELVAHSLTPPQRDSLEWYRLACFLPAQMPPGALIGADAAAREQATVDYLLVLRDLGPCQRNRG